MTRLLAILLVLGLALPARSEEPRRYGVLLPVDPPIVAAAPEVGHLPDGREVRLADLRPLSQSATGGRKVDLEAGAPAPFRGALVDEAYARVLLERRRTAELAADEALLVADRERQRRQDCEEACEARQPGTGPSTATIVALVVTAAAAGLLGGVWLGAQAAK